MGNSSHYFRPLKSAMLARSMPDMSGVEEARIRESDRAFQEALLAAYARYEFPGQVKPEPEPVVTRPTPAKRHPLFSIWEE